MIAASVISCAYILWAVFVVELSYCSLSHWRVYSRVFSFAPASPAAVYWYPDYLCTTAHPVIFFIYERSRKSLFVLSLIHI